MKDLRKANNRGNFQSVLAEHILYVCDFWLWLWGEIKQMCKVRASVAFTYFSKVYPLHIHRFIVSISCMKLIQHLLFGCVCVSIVPKARDNSCSFQYTSIYYTIFTPKLYVVVHRTSDEA